MWGLTLIHKARHLAEAASGGGARVSDANSYSKIGNGAVTNLRRCADIDGAIEGKLLEYEVNRLSMYLRINSLANKNCCSFQCSFLDQRIRKRRSIA